MTKEQSMHHALIRHCAEIACLFKPGAKVSVIVRNPNFDGSEEYSASVFVSADDVRKVRYAMCYLADMDSLPLKKAEQE